MNCYQILMMGTELVPEMSIFNQLLWPREILLMSSALPTVGEATTVSRNETAKKNTSYFEAILCALYFLKKHFNIFVV
jgi:hypothetical protein